MLERLLACLTVGCVDSTGGGVCDARSCMDRAEKVPCGDGFGVMVASDLPLSEHWLTMGSIPGTNGLPQRRAATAV